MQDSSCVDGNPSFMPLKNRCSSCTWEYASILKDVGQYAWVHLDCPANIPNTLCCWFCPAFMSFSMLETAAEQQLILMNDQLFITINEGILTFIKQHWRTVKLCMQKSWNERIFFRLLQNILINVHTWQCLWQKLHSYLMHDGLIWIPL